MKLSLLCAPLILAGVALSQTKPKDFDGWGKVKWGMTVRQAKAALAPDARESDGKSGRSTKYVDRLVIDKLKVGGTEMMVTIDTLPGSDKVKQVAFRLPDGVNTTNGAAFEDLRNALTQKYGKPTRQESNEANKITTDSVTWVFPSTVIDLTWIRAKDIGFEILNLLYEATDKKALDVL